MSYIESAPTASLAASLGVEAQIVPSGQKNPRNRRWRRSARVMVAVDAHNLHLSLPPGSRPEYRKLIDFAAAYGSLVNASVYIPRLNNGEGQRRELINLKRDGFTHIVARALRQRPNDQKKSDLDTCIIMDVWEAVLRSEVDLVILVSGDSDFVPLVEGLVRHGVQIFVIGPESATAWELEVSATRFWNASAIEDFIQPVHADTTQLPKTPSAPGMQLPAAVHPANAVSSRTM